MIHVESLATSLKSNPLNGNRETPQNHFSSMFESGLSSADGKRVHKNSTAHKKWNIFMQPPEASP
jgi:hypothetical protein